MPGLAEGALLEEQALHWGNKRQDEELSLRGVGCQVSLEHPGRNVWKTPELINVPEPQEDVLEG